MIALLQRVSFAKVIVNDQAISSINKGLLAFIAITKQDDKPQANRLLERILTYRVFADNLDKLNLNLQQIQGSLLLVPQFTLAADTKKGTRPSFSPAAHPDEAKALFEYLVAKARTEYELVACGEFGANMQVHLCNDGPLTFWLES